MVSIPARILHYVFKIGDRAKNAHFFRNVLGMQVLRHEEFKEGCEAQCNGPYDNRWSKTMVGYGPEATHFVIELTYNYGVTNYEMGNDFGGITLTSRDVLERAKSQNYPVTEEGDKKVLTSPDGYKFYITVDELPAKKDPITEVCLHSSNLKRSLNYWHDILKMELVSENERSATLHYSRDQAQLRIHQIEQPLNRAQAYGRIAFAVPKAVQPDIDRIIKEKNEKILKELVSLDTPGKAIVQVIILADPDGHEICFVDEEGFSELSLVDRESNAALDKYIKKDPFQK